MEKQEVNNVEEVIVEEETVKEQTIDFDKFDQAGKPEVELTPEQEYQKKIEELEARAKAAEERAAKVKAAFDKAASDRAKLTKKVEEEKKIAEEPLEKLQEYEAKLAEYELNEKKTNLTYSLTESLGVNKETSERIVSAIYHEDTNELSVGDLELVLREIFNDVREMAFKQGYETRDTEFASGKPRSIGGQERLSAAERKRQEYLEQHNRR